MTRATTPVTEATGPALATADATAAAGRASGSLPQSRQSGPDPDGTLAVVVFHSAQRRFGLPAVEVDRVLAAIEITPLAGAPEVIAGIINLHGRVLAVLDLRRRLGIGPTPPSLDAKLIVTTGATRPIALLADALDGVRDIACASIARCAALVPGASLVTRIAAVPEGMIFIQDVEAFLSGGEEADLDAALGALDP